MRCTLLMPVLTEDAIVVRCTIPFLESASILGNTLIYILPSSTIMRSSPDVHRYPVGQICHAVAQILTFAFYLFFIAVHQHQLIRNALHR